MVKHALTPEGGIAPLVVQEIEILGTNLVVCQLVALKHFSPVAVRTIKRLRSVGVSCWYKRSVLNVDEHLLVLLCGDFFLKNHNIQSFFEKLSVQK